jgi:carbamoyl-phosphate synthase large subunit
MKSVGEAMAIGRTFKESLQKAMRSLETGSYGFEPTDFQDEAELRRACASPNAQRLWAVADAFRIGLSIEEVEKESRIDPWFLRNVQEIVAYEDELRAAG